MTRFQKYEKWPFSNILTKAVSSKAKLPKMVDFVDEIEINKITIQTQHKSFQSRSRLFFHGLQKSFWINCVEERALTKRFLVLRFSSWLIIIFTVFFFIFSRKRS